MICSFLLCNCKYKIGSIFSLIKYSHSPFIPVDKLAILQVASYCNSMFSEFEAKLIKFGTIPDLKTF